MFENTLMPKRSLVQKMKATSAALEIILLRSSITVTKSSRENRSIYLKPRKLRKKPSIVPFITIEK